MDYNDREGAGNNAAPRETHARYDTHALARYAHADA